MGTYQEGQSHRISFWAGIHCLAQDMQTEADAPNVPGVCVHQMSRHIGARKINMGVNMDSVSDASVTKHFIDDDVIARLRHGDVRPRCFADISDGNDFGAISGRKAKIKDILGRDIIITGFQTAPSRKKADSQFITIQFLIDGELRIVWTGSVVLQRLLEKYADKLPFQAKIQKYNDALVLE